jgi:hypothetical protein
LPRNEVAVKKKLAKKSSLLHVKRIMGYG